MSDTGACGGGSSDRAAFRSSAWVFMFKRYDFGSIYALRLAYYGVWHIAWGHIRLELLF